MSKLLIVTIIIYLLLFPSFASEQYHSYGGASLEEKPVLSEIGAKRWALETGLMEENSLAYNIIDCESKWREWECNRDHGCVAGIGLWQIVVSTWNETITRMSKADADMPERCWQLIHHPMSDERREIIFDGECNLLVGSWLLEKDGDVHWQEYSGSCYLIKKPPEMVAF